MEFHGILVKNLKSFINFVQICLTLFNLRSYAQILCLLDNNAINNQIENVASCQKTVESFPPNNYNHCTAGGHIDQVSDKVLHGTNTILCFDEEFCFIWKISLWFLTVFCI